METTCKHCNSINWKSGPTVTMRSGRPDEYKQNTIECLSCGNTIAVDFDGWMRITRETYVRRVTALKKEESELGLNAPQKPTSTDVVFRVWEHVWFRVKKFADGQMVNIALPDSRLLQGLPLEPGTEPGTYTARVTQKFLDILDHTDARRQFLQEEETRQRYYASTMKRHDGDRSFVMSQFV